MTRSGQRACQDVLEYARYHQLKVDVVCPVVIHYVNKHPEYKPLLGTRGYL